MAYGVRDVEIDYEAINEMARSWNSPCGTIIRAATEHVESTMRATAPVSGKGSRYSPPGHLKSTVRTAVPDHHNADGVILGLAGVGVNRSGGSYPYAARFINMFPATIISNPYIDRRTGLPIRGRKKTYRPAHNLFLVESLFSLSGWTYYVP